MDDDLDPQEQDSPVIDRKVLLIALGGLATLAVILAVLRAKTAPKATTTTGGVFDHLGTEVWTEEQRASIEATVSHLAHNFDLRLNNVVDRLEAIANERITTAAMSVPTPGVNGDIPTAFDRVPPDMSTVGQTEPAPPGPAAVSMPPSE